MIYGYCRISTKQQFHDGTYKQQLAMLESNGVLTENIYFDNLSGKNIEDRLQLNQLLDIVKEGDTVIVTKLDRLARNVSNALELAEIFNSKGVVLNVLDIGIMDNQSITGKLIFTVFSAFAEFERNLITERMQNGRQFKRENDKDYKEGRKRKLSSNQLKNLHKLFEQESMTNQEIADLYNVSLRTILYRKREWKDTLEVINHE